MTNRLVNERPLPQLPVQKKRRAGRIVLCILLALLLLFFGTFGALYLTGKLNLHKDGNLDLPSGIADSVFYDGKVVQYNGSTYQFNENAVNVLFLGVDKADLYEESTQYGGNGQADSIFVLNLDTKTGKIKILPISRETIEEVNLYSASGQYIGVKETQICLAYAYGTSNKESCKNMSRSVGRLLYGMQFSAVVSIDLSGVGVMTDAVGGVSLKAIETIGDFKKDREVTLLGNQAIYYIRLRAQDLESNNRRMERQKQFVRAFASKAGNELLRSRLSKLPTYYNTAKPYTYTDLSLSDVTYLATACLTNNVGNEIVYNSISGTLKSGEHTEFYPDETSVFEAVLNTFYLKVA